VTLRRACCTVLLGEHAGVTEQPVAASSTVPFYCFTDDPDLTSQTWEVIRVDARFALDSARSARRLKILGDERLLDLDESLWIDEKVVLLADPATVLDDWLSDHDIALPVDTHRRDVADEFRAVVAGGLDDPARVWEQLNHYELAHPELLTAAPLWTGIMARRHGRPMVDRAMTAWFEDVLRYSMHDQLSVQAALTSVGLDVRRVDHDALAAAVDLTEDVHLPPAPSASWQTSAQSHLARVRDLEEQCSTCQAMKDESARLAELSDALDEERRDLLASLLLREQALISIHAAGRWPDWASRLRSSQAMAPARAAYHAARKVAGRE
jgi:hypothetical protein